MMKQIIKFTLILIFYHCSQCYSSEYINSSESNICQESDPNNVKDVFNCLSTGKLPDRNINDCGTYISIYKDRLRKSGIKGDDVNRLIPNCVTIAMVTKELYGELPFWEKCTGYQNKDNFIHLKECMSNFLSKNYNNKFNQIIGCDKVINEYQSAIRSATEDRSLPSNFIKPDCEKINIIISTFTGKAPVQHPCSGFDQNNIAAHVSKCFESQEMKKYIINVRNCNDARQKYEEKLREAYGDFPKGYIKATCSDLEQIIIYSNNYRDDIERERERERERKSIASKELSQQTVINKNANFSQRDHVHEVDFEKNSTTSDKHDSTKEKSINTSEKISNFNKNGYEEPEIILNILNNSFNEIKYGDMYVKTYLFNMSKVFNDKCKGSFTLQEQAKYKGYIVNNAVSSSASNPLSGMVGLAQLMQTMNDPNSRSKMSSDMAKKNISPEMAKNDAILLIDRNSCNNEITDQFIKNTKEYLSDASIFAPLTDNSYINACKESKNSKKLCECFLMCVANDDVSRQDQKLLLYDFKKGMNSIWSKNPSKYMMCQQ